MLQSVHPYQGFIGSDLIVCTYNQLYVIWGIWLNARLSKHGDSDMCTSHLNILCSFRAGETGYISHVHIQRQTKYMNRQRSILQTTAALCWVRNTFTTLTLLTTLLGP